MNGLHWHSQNQAAMRTTFRRKARRGSGNSCLPPRGDADVDERFDVEKSTRAAAKYIRRQLDAFDGDMLWAVAAYNAGGTNLKRATGYRKGMDFETVRTIRPAAYALARTVQEIMKEMSDGK